MSIEYIEYTIRDLSQSPSPLQQFRDPRNFTKPLVGWGLERLRSNPMSRLDDPAVILAIIDNEIIGRLGAFASSTVYEGRRIDTLALSGFDLDETYIQTGAGGVILLRALHWKRPLSVCGGPSANLQRNGADEAIRLFNTGSAEVGVKDWGYDYYIWGKPSPASVEVGPADRRPLSDPRRDGAGLAR